jgi:hypothetical protein
MRQLFTYRGTALRYFNPGSYLRRILVCDGIVEGKFPCSERDLRGFRIWIPQELKSLELHLLSKLKGFSSILFEYNSHLRVISFEEFSNSLVK